ncbi:MAG: SMI1/KNR4 family protein [Polyangiaceae bacterium]
MKFENSQAPLTDELLSSAETEIGIRFPPGLRAHYLRTNGGVPDTYIFRRGACRDQASTFTSCSRSFLTAHPPTWRTRSLFPGRSTSG